MSGGQQEHFRDWHSDAFAAPYFHRAPPSQCAPLICIYYRTGSSGWGLGEGEHCYQVKVSTATEGSIQNLHFKLLHIPLFLHYGFCVTDDNKVQFQASVFRMKALMILCNACTWRMFVVVHVVMDVRMCFASFLRGSTTLRFSSWGIITESQVGKVIWPQPSAPK